jgi:replicative DNA helicase
VSHEDFDRFVRASQQLAALRLYIDDTPALTVSALRTRSRRLMRQQGLGLIIVDYLQLLRASNQVRVIENRVQEVSDITRGLKALAKELNVPVLALSQLSRAVEQREDKRAMLADLRESVRSSKTPTSSCDLREEYKSRSRSATRRGHASADKRYLRVERSSRECTA